MEVTLPYDDWMQKNPAERDKEIHSCLCGIKTLLEELPVGGGVESVTATNDSIVVDNTDPLNPTVGLPYKVYRALLTQTGTDAPTATILENTIGQVPTYGYEGEGVYSINVTGSAFADHKTTVQLTAGYSNVSDICSMNYYIVDQNAIHFNFVRNGALADDRMTLSSIQILVYP